MPSVKVTYNFSLPEEQTEFDELVAAPKLHRGSDDFREWMRRMEKNIDETFWPSAHDCTADDPSYRLAAFDPVVYWFFFEKIRERYWACLMESGATLD